MPEAANNAFAFVLYLAGLFLAFAILGYTIHICANDARRRGKSPLFVCIACIFFFPWGTLAWLLFRPDPIDPSGSLPPFRLDDHRIQ
jgi:hypothetical protein